jgi:hypothetical protein
MTIPISIGIGKNFVTRTIQPQELVAVDKTNKFGRSCTFLWNAANPNYDATDNWIGASSGHSFTANVRTYTQIAANTYGTVRGKALNYSGTVTDSVIFKAKRYGFTNANNLRINGQAFTVSYLMRYIGPRFNQQVDQIALGNSLSSSMRWVFGNTIASGNVFPYMLTTSSYLVGGAYVGAAGEYTIGNFYFVTWVFRSDGTDCYINGTLNSTSANVHNNNDNIDNIAVRTGTETLIAAFTLNRALNASEVAELSQNPWQLFQPKVRILSGIELPAYVPQPLIGGKYNRPTTNNLKDYPQVATNNSIARDLYNIMVMGRRAAYSLTSISANNYQRSDHTPGNPASWSSVRRIFDSKYGIGNNVPTSSTDDIRDINVFNTFQKDKGATLLAVTKFQSTTNVINAWDFLRTGAGYTLGLGMQFQSTGTELQLRSAGYRSSFGMQYSSWATVPADTILVIVLTNKPGIGEKLYVNGNLLSQQTSVILGLDDNFNNNTKIGLGHPAVFNSTNNPKTAHYFAATWGRPLTELEVREISANPLQLLKPSTRTFYTTMPSGVIVPRNRFLFFFN